MKKDPTAILRNNCKYDANTENENKLEDVLYYNVKEFLKRK